MLSIHIASCLDVKYDYKYISFLEVNTEHKQSCKYTKWFKKRLH